MRENLVRAVDAIAISSVEFMMEMDAASDDIDVSRRAADVPPDPAAASPALRDAGAFFEAVAPDLVRTLTVRVGDRATAEDLAHEALARALVHWDRVSAMASPVGWVYRVAFNLAASRWRRVKRRMRIEAAADQSEPGTHLVTAEALVVREAMSRLSERQRQVVVLRYYSGFNVSEVAEILQVSESTVKTQTARALARMRIELGDDDERR